jgi:hypothetical protein
MKHYLHEGLFLQSHLLLSQLDDDNFMLPKSLVLYLNSALNGLKRPIKKERIAWTYLMDECG